MRVLIIVNPKSVARLYLLRSSYRGWRMECGIVLLCYCGIVLLWECGIVLLWECVNQIYELTH